MQIRELDVPGAYEVTPVIHGDDRGAFLEWYRFDRLQEAVGHPLDLRQGNLSISRRGTLRGVHFAEVPRGQAKYITVIRGAAIDFIVDIRVGSPTFGRWEAVRLDAQERKAVYLAEGLGHAFLALEDDTVLTYLVSDVYNQAREHGVNPLDPAIGLEFPVPAEELVLSPRDEAAPTLAEAGEQGLLPSWEECRAFYAELDGVVR